MPHGRVKPEFDEAAILALERPHASLWTYYILNALIIPPLAPVLLVVLWFRYHTMRYQFTDEGVSMSWGILWRRQIVLNYARIQDIHLQSNFVERWLGLARVMIQTASGSSSAEMTIEGLKEFEQVRDFLYSKMRGIKDAQTGVKPAASQAATGPHPELAAALREVAGELREVRRLLAAARSPGKEADHE